MAYRVFVIICIVCAFSKPGSAQSGFDKEADKTSLKGTILSAEKTPIAYATVTLMKQDSSLVNGALTDDKGNFEIAPAAIGNFMLKISGIGINQKVITGINITTKSPKKNIGEVTVSTTSQMMKEVEITAEKPLMEIGIDKKVFNVEKNITTAGGSASDVLQNVPSVSVDVDGNVSLRGKSNVTILIDGKPATLLGGDDASALQSLPAASVEQVEVITNPSAKYDAQGMTGIINIVTKREKKFGLNGSVSLGAGTRDKYNGSLNMNLKNEKWNVFLNSSFRQNRRYNRSTIDRDNKLNNGSSNSYEDNLHIFNGFFNSIGAEYRIDTNNSITLTQNINTMTWGGKGNTTYEVYSDENTRDTRQERYSERGGGPLSLSTNLDYKHKFNKKGRELSLSNTYAKSWTNRDQYYSTSVYNGNDALISGPVEQNAPGEGVNSSNTSQLDYTSPMLTKNGKLDMGLKSQLFWFESHNNPTKDSANTGSVVDKVLLNSYDYTQQILAAYTNWGDKVGKFRYQAGLRLEYAYYEGTTLALNGARYTNKFLNLFPSAYVSYELPHDQSIYLSYTRRTDRPRFWHMLPYLDLSNPQDTTAGNPNLIPEFIHNFEFSYNKIHEKGHILFLSAYYQYTQNLIERYRIVYSDGTSFNQRQNLSAGVTYGMEVTGTAQLVDKIWDMTVNMNFFRNEILGANIDPTLDNSGFGWFAKANTNIKFTKDFSLQINGNYESAKVVAQGTRKQVYWLDVAIRKNLLKNKANLVLNVSDIFNTRKYTTEYEFDRYFQRDYRDRETRIGNISFTYRFGGNDKEGKFFGKRRGRSRQNDAKPDLNKDRDNIRQNDGDGGDGGY